MATRKSSIPQLTHLDADGRPAMVDVSAKAVTARSNKAGKPAVTRKTTSARTSKKQATALKSTRKAKAASPKKPVAQPAGKAKRTQAKTNKVKKTPAGKPAARQKK